MVTAGCLKIFITAVAGICNADLNFNPSSALDKCPHVGRVDVYLALGDQGRDHVSICVACV